MRVPSASAERYVEQALAMIDREGESRGVNLRELSRELGCAHTNAYNYFDGLDDLLSQALVSATQRQLDHSLSALASGGVSPFRRLDALIEASVDFALAHPGWYRFIWLEPLRSPPPESVLTTMQQAGAALVSLLIEATEGTLSPRNARLLAEDFHSFLHGMICKALAGRVEGGDAKAGRGQLIARARRVLRQLIDQRQEP